MKSEKLRKRLRRHRRVRAKVFGTAKRPRLAVFRSAKHIYAQFIDDEKQVSLGGVSDLKLPKKGEGKIARAVEVGKLAAALAKKLKISEVVFDRGGFKYHGRVKALADAARKAGLKF